MKLAAECNNKKIIPDFQPVKHGMWQIVMESSHLTSLEGKNLQNLTEVDYVSFRKNSIQCIEPDVFKGMEKLFELDLSHNLLTSIPLDLLISSKKLAKFDASYNNFLHLDNLPCITQSEILPAFKYVKDTIKEIKIESTRLASLEGTSLQNVTSVKQLYFSKNSIQFIDRDFFKGLENVETLDLSYNLLTSLPPNLLDSMKNLVTLSLSHNNLTSIHSLFSTKSQSTEKIKTLDLSYNLLKSLPLHLLDPMKNLVTFSISHNNLLHIGTLSSTTFPKNIHLDFNNIANIKRILCLDKSEQLQSYAPISKTRSEIIFETTLIDLSYNSIKKIPEAFLVCDRRRNLQAHRRTVKPQFRVKDLKLVGNELQNLNACFKYSRIVKIDASRNQIQNLTDKDFRFVYDTTHLMLQENQIRLIGKYTFEPIGSYLKYLDLRSNKITSLNKSVRYLSHLKFLDLSYNSIQTFEKNEFADLFELSELHLQKNQIRFLGQLHHLHQMRFLNVSHNNIRFIKPEQLPETLTSLDLADNPFKCDCRLQPFIDFLMKTHSLKSDVSLCFRSDHGNRRRETLNCPDMCSCRCAANGNTTFMFVDCSSQNLSELPQLFRNYSKEKKETEIFTPDTRRRFVMNQNIHPSLFLEDRVLGMSLENNNLEFLDAAQLPPNLHQLYLANNKLSWLPESFFDKQMNLKQVSLSRNPWSCDCNALKLKKWLTTKKNNIRDIDDIRCGVSCKRQMNLNRKIIWKLTDDELCPATEEDFAISISFGVVLILVIFGIAARILYTKYDFIINHHLSILGIGKKDYEYKEFDAFVAFSHEDDEFVIKEIIEEIENRDPNIRLCLHYRHFKAGAFIIHNITYAVRNSRKTLIILSRNFLKSEWCLQEFHAAHIQTLEDKTHQIIIVKVGDLPKKVDYTINVYLKYTTYLTWRENSFFEKLLSRLPSGTKARNSVSIWEEDNESVLNFPS